MRFLTIFRKELLVESRRKESLFASLFFALLLVVIASFGFGESGRMSSRDIAGLFWIIYTFSTTMVLTRSFRAEDDQGFIFGAMLAGTKPEAIFLGKLLFNWAAATIIATVVWLGLTLFLNLPIAPHLGTVILLAALTSIGLCALGTFFAAMFYRTKVQHLVVPITFYPMILPLILPAMHATRDVLEGHSISGWHLILSFNVIFLAVTYMFFNLLVED